MKTKKPKPSAKPRKTVKNRRQSTNRHRAKEPADEFFGRLKGKFRIVGDIESPVVPPEAWEYD